MSDIEKQLSHIRPSLRIVAPQTYYISWGFAVFNVLAGLSLMNFPQTQFLIVGAINLKAWAIIFVVMGVLFLYALLTNQWRMLRSLHLMGVMVKTVWLMELVARAIVGKSFVLVCIWALLLYLQAVTYRYFTPVESRNVR